MSSEKAQNIIQLSNRLSFCEEKIKLTKKILNSSCKITISDLAGDNEVVVWEPLRIPLRDFLLNHFNEEIENIYNEISKELKS